MIRTLYLSALCFALASSGLHAATITVTGVFSYTDPYEPGQKLNEGDTFEITVKVDPTAEGTAVEPFSFTTGIFEEKALRYSATMSLTIPAIGVFDALYPADLNVNTYSALKSGGEILHRRNAYFESNNELGLFSVAEAFKPATEAFSADLKPTLEGFAAGVDEYAYFDFEPEVLGVAADSCSYGLSGRLCFGVGSVDVDNITADLSDFADMPAPVPLPATGALLMGGVLAIGLTRRRRS